jgi:hypothetical protein
MPSRLSRGRIRAWVRLSLSPCRATSRAFRVFLVAVAAAFGAPKPKLLRHEDAVAQVGQVAEEDAAQE